ncbi:MAG: hypothetical protein ACK4WH_02440 [Phycisphaerales bacterium]
MNKAMMSVWVCAAATACGSASAAGPLWSEGINGDLPNLPMISPMVTIPGYGCTFAAQGFVGVNQVDVDFITILIPFPASQVLIDLDTGLSHQDSVLGVGSFHAYPVNPLLINDDDSNSADDALCGHALFALDSLVDVTAVTGPLGAGATLTIAIGRSGEQFNNWDGTASLNAKLEYGLFVYIPIPAPGGAGLLGFAGLTVIRRPRRVLTCRPSAADRTA